MKHLLIFQLGLWLVVLVVACSPETDVPAGGENAAASLATVPQPPTITPEPTLTLPPTFTPVVPTDEPTLVAITPTYCFWRHSGGSASTGLTQSVEEAMSSAAISGTVRISTFGENLVCEGGTSADVGYHPINTDFEFAIWVPDPTDATSVVPIVEELIRIANASQGSGGSPAPNMGNVHLLFRNDKQYCSWNIEDGQWVPSCYNS